MKREISWINGLKGIACLCIVLTHLPILVDNNVALVAVVASGARGVQFFFVISSFLLFLSLNKEFGENYIDFRSGVKWICRKVLRLIPLYYFAFICSYYIRIRSGCDINFVSIILHLMFLHGINPQYCNCIVGGEWYLGVLFFVYLIVPFLYNKIKSFDVATTVFSTSLFVCIVLKIILQIRTPQGCEEGVWDNYVCNFSLLGQFSVIMLGIVFYFIYMNKISFSKKVSYSLFFFSLYFIYILVRLRTMEYEYWGFACLLILVSLTNAKNVFIDNKVFNIIGKYSYGIYLFHPILIGEIKFDIMNVQNQWIKYIVSYLLVVVGSFILSFVFTNILEKPLTRVGARLVRKL